MSRATATEAVAIFARERPAVAIADLGLPPDPDGATEGLKAVSDFLDLSPTAKVIVVTGNDNREHAVKAVASGAYDFLKKPVDPELLKLTVERALRLSELEDENRRLSALAAGSSVAGIVGSSPQMQKVLRDIEKLAKTDIAILILGESGTGKELLALAAHQMSRRARPSRSSPSTARRFRKGCSKPNSSVTKEARSRARCARTSARSKARMAARCSSTKSATSRWPCRSSCSGFSKTR